MMAVLSTRRGGRAGREILNIKLSISNIKYSIFITNIQVLGSVVLRVLFRNVLQPSLTRDGAKTFTSISFQCFNQTF